MIKTDKRTFDPTCRDCTRLADFLDDVRSRYPVYHAKPVPPFGAARVPLLVVGLAVPTPGAVGGFHAMFRLGATTFFGAPDDAAVGAAIVLHLFSVGPTLLLGLLFAAQEGLNVSGMRSLADRADSEGTA